MRILITGKPMEEHWLKFRCSDCLTKFEAQVKEGEQVKGGRMTAPFVKINCPVCERVVESDLSRRTLEPIHAQNVNNDAGGINNE